MPCKPQALTEDCVTVLASTSPIPANLFLLALVGVARRLGRFLGGRLMHERLAPVLALVDRHAVSCAVGLATFACRSTLEQFENAAEHNVLARGLPVH